MLTLADLQKAQTVVQESPLCRRTPMLHDMQEILELSNSAKLHLKLENMQPTGWCNL